MSRRERNKGVRGEREVLERFKAAGFTVRGLEGSGDHLAIGHGLLLHVESKRQETARPWQWWEQASSETPDGAVTIVAFRRSHSRWLVIADLETLLGIFARMGNEAAELTENVAELAHALEDRGVI